MRGQQKPSCSSKDSENRSEKDIDQHGNFEDARSLRSQVSSTHVIPADYIVRSTSYGLVEPPRLQTK
jgi:hypothetical protein